MNSFIFWFRAGHVFDERNPRAAVLNTGHLSSLVLLSRKFLLLFIVLLGAFLTLTFGQARQGLQQHWFDDTLAGSLDRYRPASPAVKHIEDFTPRPTNDHMQQRVDSSPPTGTIEPDPTQKAKHPIS